MTIKDFVDLLRKYDDDMEIAFLPYDMKEDQHVEQKIFSISEKLDEPRIEVNMY